MITVVSFLAVQAVLDAVRGQILAELPEILKEFERSLPREQQAWWARRFNRGWKHAKATVEERAKGLGNPVRGAKRRRATASVDSTYYDRNRPNRGAAADEPYYFWTGRMLESTTKFTTSTPLGARIDTGANYRGPLTREGFSDPVEEIMVRGAKPVEPWDVGRLDAVMDMKINDGLSRIVRRIGA